MGAKEAGEGRPLWQLAGVVLGPLGPASGGWMGRLVSAFQEKREERLVESLDFN